jgi:predicted 3-demethylubiquinone-9 3-methyltransferase (glyoxalase superfamily)
MVTTVTPFLLFGGNAEEAINFYVSVFPGAKIDEILRYVANEPGAEGSIKRARLTIASQSIFCTDSTVQQPFSFTPAISLFVQCASEAEIDSLYLALHEGGSTLMALGNYGFSQKFGWINDRFGVSWQLNF